MLPEFIMNRRTYLITGIVFAVICLLGFSFAYFQTYEADVNSNKISVGTVSGSQYLHTVFESGGDTIETGFLNLTTNSFQRLMKFKTTNLFETTKYITINWNLVQSSLIQEYSSYELYQCSNNTTYTNATINNLASTCTLVSPTTNNYLPNTGEKWALQSANEIEIDSNETLFYALVLTIGLNNSERSFSASIKIKYTDEYVLTLDLDGGIISGNISMDILSGNTMILPTPQKSNYFFDNWKISEGGIDSSVSRNSFTMGTENTTIKANWIPLEDIFTYTGNYVLIDDGNGNWRIKFLSTGAFVSSVNMAIDVFAVGGGAGGSSDLQQSRGGGGGYTTTTKNVIIKADKEYLVTIGEGGATGVGKKGGTSIFGNYGIAYALGGGGGYLYASGGSGGGGQSSNDGAGSLGGAGGSDGSNGFASDNGVVGGHGQGITTREFGELTGDLYSGGGGGGPRYRYGSIALGGAGGGGASAAGSSQYVAPVSGGINTGGGGGGIYNASSGASGGSGIVIIRNAQNSTISDIKINELANLYTYSGTDALLDDGNGNWRIKFLSSGTFVLRKNIEVDAFAVGGGAGGSGDIQQSRGGGGGYTTTVHNIFLTAYNEYSVVIGAGGSPASAGQSSYFIDSTTCQALGGSGANGGSGGGGQSSNDGAGSLGGVGGSDGSDGLASDNGVAGGVGQGTTTREFGELFGTLYSGGGGGGPRYRYAENTLGGAGGGGDSATGSSWYVAPVNGFPNTGGGGGGRYNTKEAASGGSGIVIIRNKR